VPQPKASPQWGKTPWTIDFHPESGPLPNSVDFAVVGGGFTGLSAAASLRHLDRERTVALFEAEGLGARSSGRTGGLILPETAAGDLPGLGDVLAGVTRILGNLGIDCDLTLPGVWELDRKTRGDKSPICWNDSGELRVRDEVAGGSANPGKLVSGLGRAAAERGVLLFERACVEHIGFGETLDLHVRGKQIKAGHLLIATNAESLELSSLVNRAVPKLTMAIATAPIPDANLDALGMNPGKPFYTEDLPYLWGRPLHPNRIVFGSGLVDVQGWRELRNLRIDSGEPARLIENLERRIRGLHSALADVELTHRWAGPILIAEKWKPVFSRHPKSSHALVLGAYSGHGVALSVYLGEWAAQVMLGKRSLPMW
jgi:glycine/D-amino acid oxidase-like deaminating enzyme